MSTAQRIAKNTTALLVAQVASCLLAFFYMMYTARCRGAAGFGILSFAQRFMRGLARALFERYGLKSGDSVVEMAMEREHF
jgi:O-antigen/teichoic acid export membrane protein